MSANARIATLLVALLGCACGGGDGAAETAPVDGSGGGPSGCSPGKRQACDAAGCLAARPCLDDGSWGECQCETLRGVHIDDIYDPFGMALSQGVLYWGDGGTINRVAAGERTPEAFWSPGGDLTCFHADDSYVYTGTNVGSNYLIRRSFDGASSASLPWGETGLDLDMNCFSSATGDDFVFALCHSRYEQFLLRLNPVDLSVDEVFPGIDWLWIRWFDGRLLTSSGHEISEINLQNAATTTLVMGDISSYVTVKHVSDRGLFFELEDTLYRVQPGEAFPGTQVGQNVRSIATGPVNAYVVYEATGDQIALEPSGGPFGTGPAIYDHPYDPDGVEGLDVIDFDGTYLYFVAVKTYWQELYRVEPGLLSY